MKRYKNVSSTTLALDCITKTVYLKPGEILTLPRSRDVRYYSGLGKLVIIREPKPQRIPAKEPEVIKQTLPQEKEAPKKRSSRKQEEEETNNNKMETE